MLQNLCAKGAIALLMVLAAGLTPKQPATAQTANAPDRSLGSIPNLLYFPRASERFFEEGRVQLEQEIQTLMQRRYTQPETLLDVSNDVTIQEDLLRLEDPSFHSIRSQEDNIIHPR